MLPVISTNRRTIRIEAEQSHCQCTTDSSNNIIRRNRDSMQNLSFFLCERTLLEITNVSRDQFVDSFDRYNDANYIHLRVIENKLSDIIDVGSKHDIKKKQFQFNSEIRETYFTEHLSVF